MVGKGDEITSGVNCKIKNGDSIISLKSMKKKYDRQLMYKTGLTGADKASRFLPDCN
jgi:hypothetical protein